MYRQDNGAGKRVRRSKLLGWVSRMTKSKARERLAEILKPINEAKGSVSRNVTVKDFVENVYLPFYRKKWKRITDEARTASIKYYIVGAFGKRQLASLTRDEPRRFLMPRSTLLILSSTIFGGI
jgi:hypothetical protein